MNRSFLFNNRLNEALCSAYSGKKRTFRRSHVLYTVDELTGEHPKKRRKKTSLFYTKFLLKFQNPP